MLTNHKNISREVSWQVDISIKVGKFAAFTALNKKMIDFAKTETGVLVYERFASPDGRMVYVYERYIDSPSAVSHLLMFRKMFSKQFSDIVERKRFLVFGDPSNDLRNILNEFGATYCGFVDGFSSISEHP